jgi:hypothetical protein
MRKMPFTDSRKGALETSAEAQGGVGGLAGMKNDGRQATVDCIIAQKSDQYSSNEQKTFDKITRMKKDVL